MEFAIQAENSVREAIFAGDLDSLRQQAKLNPESLYEPDKEGWLPLHDAVRIGKVEPLKFLLDVGTDINYKTNFGASPLYLSRFFHGEKHEVTRFLVDKGAIDIHPEF